MLNAFKGRVGRWLLTGLLLAGCDGICCCAGGVDPDEHVEEDEVVGTWNGPHGGTLTLDADGTFSRVGVIECGGTSEEPGETPVNDAGTWRFYEPYAMKAGRGLELTEGTRRIDTLNARPNGHMAKTIQRGDAYVTCWYSRR
ncbi:hypothetical protein [Longispora urticae]